MQSFRNVAVADTAEWLAVASAVGRGGHGADVLRWAAARFPLRITSGSRSSLPRVIAWRQQVGEVAV